MAPKVHKTIQIQYSRMVPSKTKSQHFIIHHQGNYIVYVPKRGIAALVNKDFVEQIGKNNKIVENFFRYVNKQDKVPTLRSSYARQNSLILSFTTDCNMCCTYCYARAGENAKYMSWATAKTALDYCLSKSGNTFYLSLHASGEPTLAFDMMKRSYSYAKEQCDKQGKQIKTCCATNGIITEKQIKWFKDNNVFILLSIDGPTNIQNRQRVMTSGKGSYDHVRKTISLFNKYGVNYQASATVTKYSEDKMLDTVKHFISLGIKKISMEPCYSCGRASESQSPDYGKFVDEFIKCLEFSEKQGVIIESLSSRVYGLSPICCEGAGREFIVNSDGSIMSCFFAADHTNKASEAFIYGSIKNNKISFNNKKLKKLRSISVHKMSTCNNCFAKYICSGGCLYRNLSKTGSVLKPSKNICKPMQKLLSYYLYRLLTKRINMSGHDILIEDITAQTS